MFYLSQRRNLFLFSLIKHSVSFFVIRHRIVTLCMFVSPFFLIFMSLWCIGLWRTVWDRLLLIPPCSPWPFHLSTIVPPHLLQQQDYQVWWTFWLGRGEGGNYLRSTGLAEWQADISSSGIIGGDLISGQATPMEQGKGLTERRATRPLVSPSSSFLFECTVLVHCFLVLSFYGFVWLFMMVLIGRWPNSCASWWLCLSHAPSAISWGNSGRWWEHDSWQDRWRKAKSRVGRASLPRLMGQSAWKYCWME